MARPPDHLCQASSAGSEDLPSLNAGRIAPFTQEVGQAPFRASGGYVLWEGYVNAPHCNGFTPGDTFLPDIESSQTRQTGRRPQQSVVVKKIELDPRKVAELVCRREIDTLDIHVQDDQIVDSVRLVITKP